MMPLRIALSAVPHNRRASWEAWMQASTSPDSRSVLGQLWQRAISDRISLVAAGCAFYAMLALFPALSLIVSLYGLVFDPYTVEPQLAVLHELVPDATYALVAQRVRELVQGSRPRLERGAFISAIIALWSASAGVRAMLNALDLAYEIDSRRGMLAFYGTALLITLGAIMAVIVGMAGLVVLPVTLQLLGVEQGRALLVRAISLLVLLVAVFGAIAVLLRFGPSRPCRWADVMPGTVMAAALWTLASVGFSFYVTHIAGYDSMYGSLGAAVGLQMSFFVSVFAILLGAELNVALAAAECRVHAAAGPAPGD
jgi:membrane protein